MRRTALASLLLILTPVAGCTGAPAGDPQVQVKAAFETLQQALKAKDADKIWNLLDPESQADADRAAKAWQEAYAKAEPDKTKKDLGISADDLAKLDGKSFLKTEAFYEKEIDELVQATKIESVKVEGDKATVSYKDPKGETDKITFTRKDGQWKAHLSMEKPKKP